MVTATATDVEKHFRQWQDRALREPVTVTRDGEPEIMLLSIEEYRRLKRRDREALRVEELDEQTLAAIAASEPPEVAEQFNDEPPS